MSDIFQEVDEEVRREKLQQLWERHSNLIVAAALLVVLAVGGWRGYDWWETRRRPSPARPSRPRVLLAEGGKQDEAQAAFAKLAKEGSSGYRILARFREAAELAQDRSGRCREGLWRARGRFQPRAHDAGPRGDSRRADPGRYRAARRTRRAARAAHAADRPFRHTARELLALAAWRTGDQRGRQALVRPDRDRCRNARRHAPAHGSPDDAVRHARRKT